MKYTRMLATMVVLLLAACGESITEVDVREEAARVVPTCVVDGVEPCEVPSFPDIPEENICPREDGGPCIWI